ncbi:putative inactive ribonuclease-like protein 12 [Thomomys bottae]
MLLVRPAAKPAGVKGRDVKGILPVMILMVVIFLLLLFWENELNDNVVMTSLEHVNVDYPQNGVPMRYCNYMILQRGIREADHACKKEHVFIHERPQKINSICTSPKKVPCQNHSTMLCFQSQTRLKMTVCQLTEGIQYPACRYHVFHTAGFALITCDGFGPVHFYGYVE